MGKISPMKYSDKGRNLWKVEVLEFIEKSKSNKNMLLIDSRTENWFYHETIPKCYKCSLCLYKNHNIQMNLKSI